MLRNKRIKNFDVDEISLSTPWTKTRGNMYIQKDTFPKSNYSKDFIKERSRVHTVYIMEQEKTKRLSMVLAVILLISSLTLMLFAPEGREELSYWIGVALLIFLLQQLGISVFGLKVL